GLRVPWVSAPADGLDARVHRGDRRGDRRDLVAGAERDQGGDQAVEKRYLGRRDAALPRLTFNRITLFRGTWRTKIHPQGARFVWVGRETWRCHVSTR